EERLVPPIRGAALWRERSSERTAHAVRRRDWPVGPSAEASSNAARNSRWKARAVTACAMARLHRTSIRNGNRSRRADVQADTPMFWMRLRADRRADDEWADRLRGLAAESGRDRRGRIHRVDGRR